MSYDILISMAADVARLRTDMEQASRVVQRGVGDMQRHIASLNRALSAIGFGISVGGVITALTSMTRGAIEAADRMNELSQITGVSTETLSGWSIAARTSGTDIETLAKSLVKLSRGLMVGTEETKGAGQALAALGIDARRFLELDAEQQMLELAEAFSGIEDSGAKSAAAMALFGKEGAQLIPFLNQGREGLEEFKRIAYDLGLVIDTQTAESMDRLSDGMTVARMAMQGFGMQIARELQPTIEGLVRLFIESKREGGAMTYVIWGIGIAFKAVVTAGMAAVDIFRAIGTGLGGLFAAIKLVTEGNFSGALNALKESGSDIVTIFKEGGLRVWDMWTDSLPQLDAATRQAAKGVGEFQKAMKDDGAKELASDIAKLIEATEQYIQQLSLEVSAGTALTEQQKKMLAIGTLLAQNAHQMADAEIAYWQAKINTIAALNDEARVKKEAKERDEALLKLAIDSAETDAAKLKAINEAIKRQREQNETLGMTKEQVAQYNIKVQERILAELKLAAMTPEIDDAKLAALNAQIEAQQKLIDLMREGEIIEANVTAARESKQAWLEFARDIERALTDALVRGFESGKSVAKSIGDYIANYFRTAVARTIAQALMGAVGVGLSGIANAAMPGLAGSVGGSLLSSILPGAAAFSGFGGFAATGLMSTLTGTSLSTSLGAAGSLLTGGNIAGGIGMGIGALAPYALAAYGIYRLLTGGGRSRSPAVQNVGVSGAFGQDLGLGQFAPWVPNGGQNADYLQSARNIAAAVSSLASSFGGAINPGLAFGLFTSHSPDNRGAQTVNRVFLDGRTIFNRDINADNASMMQRLQEGIPGMILTGLQNSNLPARIAEYFNSISAQGITQEQLDNMIAVASAAHQMAEAFKDLGGPFLQLSDLSVQAREKIAGMVGGLDAFVQKVSGYVQAFYSPEEQQALQLLQAQRTLASAGIDTSGLRSRADFRAMVESLDLSTESGQRAFAALMNAAGSFAAGSDLLAATGMSLAELTAGAPGGAVLDAMATQQTTTNSILAAMNENVTGLLSAILERLANGMNVNVSVSGNAGYEVGVVGGGGN